MRLLPKNLKFSLAFKFASTVALLFVIVMLVVIFAVQKTIVNQFTEQYKQSVQTKVASIEQELTSRHGAIGRQLSQLAEKLQQDNEFRLRAAVLKDVQQQYIVDFAQNFMATMGLQALEISNESGTVLSSGQYRNAFGASDTSLIKHLQARRAEIALAWFTRTTGQFLCLTAIDSLTISGEKFYLIGGVEVTPAFLKNLQPNPGDVLLVEGPESTVVASQEQVPPVVLNYVDSNSDKLYQPTLVAKDYSVGGFDVPQIRQSALLPSHLILVHPTTELTTLLESLQARIFAIALLGVIIVIIVTVFRTNAVARPLQKLAAAAEKLSLDKLDISFNVRSNDEVGVLNNALEKMVQRLRQSRIKLATAEQKAALGEISRQVNHDIKNGFIPIRNVMNHWEEVEQQEPEELVQVFHERKSTIFESLDYLENLTKNYSRLQPKIQMQALNINKLVKMLVRTYQSLPDFQFEYEIHLSKETPWVLADEVQLRRAFENILRNAMDAMEDKGEINVTTMVEDDQVKLHWHDNGPGIPDSIKDQLFRMNISTKTDGSGLGLANAKRIIEDFDGSIAIESEEGAGTTVKITLPLTSPSGDSLSNTDDESNQPSE